MYLYTSLWSALMASTHCTQRQCPEMINSSWQPTLIFEASEVVLRNVYQAQTRSFVLASSSRTAVQKDENRPRNGCQFVAWRNPHRSSLGICSCCYRCAREVTAAEQVDLLENSREASAQYISEDVANQVSSVLIHPTANSWHDQDVHTCH